LQQKPVKVGFHSILPVTAAMFLTFEQDGDKWLFNELEVSQVSIVGLVVSEEIDKLSATFKVIFCSFNCFTTHFIDY
jgi:hypothetical protein